MKYKVQLVSGMMALGMIVSANSAFAMEMATSTKMHEPMKETHDMKEMKATTTVTHKGKKVVVKSHKNNKHKMATTTATSTR